MFNLLASYDTLSTNTTSSPPQSLNYLIVLTENNLYWKGITENISKSLNNRFINVKNSPIDEFIINPNILDNIDTLIVIPGFSLPSITTNIIMDFIKRGGNFISFGVPLWNNDLIWDGKYIIGRLQFVQENFSILAPNLFNLDKTSVKNWQRESNNLQSPAQFEYKSIDNLITGIPLHGFYSSIIDMNGWDIFTTPSLENPFPEGHRLTTFFFKGGKDTTHLTIEWRENDGSRWIASVPLTENWQFYALKPEHFKIWESPSRQGTLFNPKNAVKLCIGLAMSHSPIPSGMHQFWVAGLGTAPETEIHKAYMSSVDLPKLELFYPEYKFYSSNDIRSIETDTELALKVYPLPVPKNSLLIHPRPRGGGFNKNRLWRWIPLIHAYGKENDYRGTLSAMMIYNNGPYKCSTHTSFAVQDPEWYQNESFLKFFSEFIEKLAQGIFLIDGGCQFYTLFPEQELPLGATVFATQNRVFTDINVHLLIKNKNNRVLWEKTIPVTIVPQQLCQVKETIQYPDTGDNNLYVECKLIVNGENQDYVSHELNRWLPRDEKEYITIKDGDFIYRGERWCPHGVNYMPSSGIGVEWWRYFEYWLSAESYHPWIIQRDLQRIADIGMNSISVFLYHDNTKDQNLLDLLYRADKLGLKVNLSLRPGTPFDFEWEKIKEMIEYYRLSENDVVFAYDLAWEPMFPGHEGRKRWDNEWKEWIIERYGSIENAEKNWNYPVPKDENGNITNPEDKMLTQDGEWRVMVCAYRRFLDTLLYEYYNRARTLVCSIDKHHAISFRMTEGSNPTNNNVNPLPYDWYYLSHAVDILEPEAYGRIGNWDMVKPGWFQVKYGEFCNPHIPLFWAEIGYSIYRTTPGQTEKALNFQAEFFTHFYQMLLQSNSDGVYFWWYPGGYRVNEKSDYGIINPDGTYRPATEVIKKHKDIFKKQKKTTTDCEILIDRDKTSTGIAGIYNEVKDTFWRLIDEGKKPRLVSEGTGTNSQTCPLIAIGNVPYNGSNPPKYLDAFFDQVIWINGKDEILIQKHDTIQIPESTDTIRLKVICTNLGEAEWLPVGQTPSEGEIYLLVHFTHEQRVPLKTPLKRGEKTEFLIDIPLNTLSQPSTKDPQASFTKSSNQKSIPILLTIESLHRTQFGPKFPFTIILRK